MKRSVLVLSLVGASVFGCLAFSSTVSASPPGPNICWTNYEYCMLAGHTQAFCWQQFQECVATGQPDQIRPAAKDNVPASEPN